MCRPGRDGHGRFGNPAQSLRGNHEDARQRRLLPESSFRGCRRPSRAGLAAGRSLKGRRVRGLFATPGILAGAGSGRSGSGPDDRVRQNGVNTLKGVPAFDRIAEGSNNRVALKLSTAIPRPVRAVRICAVTGIRGGVETVVPVDGTGARFIDQGGEDVGRIALPQYQRSAGFRRETGRDFPGCGAATSARRRRERGRRRNRPPG